jgi:hypothetical protein
MNLGAIERKKDPRDVMLGKATAPVTIPPTMGVNLSWLTVNNQGSTSFCGEHAASHFQAILDYNAGQTFRFTPRYEAIKLKDPNSPVYDTYGNDAGTSMIAIFKLLQKIGADEYEPLENDVTLPIGTYLDPGVVTPSMDAIAAGHKIVNYAFDALTLQDLSQACYQKKAVILLIKCDSGFWGTSNPTFTQPLYGHFIVMYDYTPEGIWIVDSAESDPRFVLKFIDKKYLTPQFIFESGTAIDAQEFNQAIQAAVNTTELIIKEIQTQPTSSQPMLYALIAKVAQALMNLFN